ncbi:MAG TPA: KamA family radical SAM protein [Candidatus Avidesulfovibrio excrementigallinarum]|nr:KamA family radical SAM protein [Candidatus Avidesulfovibrio excrementigallinarum]
MVLQRLLKDNVTTVHGLQKYLKFDAGEIVRLEALAARFPLSIPPYYLSLIDPSDPEDPIRRMSVPDLSEEDPDGSFDTSGEACNTVEDGVQHKYGTTALVLSTHACAMYCRHCFRKRLVGLENQETGQRVDKVIDYVREHPEINNVLLSGGDALLNPTRRLKAFLEGLCAIDHLDAVRICTRTPVVLPMRIYEDAELLDLLRTCSRTKRLYMVTQFNHPRELTEQALRAVKEIEACGVTLRNQTVLLRGVNDDAEILGLLLKRLVHAGVLPYYVFQCRPVTGVKNRFQVPFAQGYDIVKRAKSMQSGLGKGFRYVLSHETGKIEILGPSPASSAWLFKYHQAKDAADDGRLFMTELEPGQCWLTSANVRRP